jgi:Mrp family chromosome partitioning ATPase
MRHVLGQSAGSDAVRSGDAELAISSGRSTAPPGSEQAFFQLNVKRSLGMHWELARKVAIAGAVVAAAYLLVQIFVLKSFPAYLAESVVYVQPTPSKVLEPQQGGTPRWPFDSNTYETYIQQQMMNVSRDDVLAGALHRLSGIQKPGESDQAAARRLVEKLSVTREGSAYQFSIGARARQPEMAAQIANAVTASYIESTVRDERSGDAQRLAMLREEKDRVQNALTADHAEQDALNQQLGVASVGTTTPDHYDEDITQIHTELVKARTDHDAAAARFASLGAGNGRTSSAIDAEADGLIASDAGLVSMKQSLNSRRATLISQMANLTPLNPLYKQDEAELTKINGTLDAMMKDLRSKAAARIQLQLRADLQRTAGVEAQLNGQLRQLVGAAGSATPKLQRASDLAADITRLQARYAAVDEQLHNLMLEDSAPPAAFQVTAAVPPLNRTKSGVLRNVFLILLAGLFFGVAAAVTANKLDPKIYIGADVEQVLGFAPMAQLPDFGEVSEGVAEEYLLRLASTIEHARKQGELRSCIVTGTGAGTGVTTLVNRVRKMLEAMGRPTVLVDATGVPALRPAASANAPGNSRGLVPYERVSRPTALLQQMAQETETREASLVLTDTAPLAVSAETEYLSRFVDCAIVVIESGMTTRDELRQVARMLERLDVGAVGFVLNRVGLAKADPTFREAVEAVGKHLQAQAASRTQSSERSRVAEEEAASSEPPKEELARGLFEPELAAAAAAVARFSAHPDPLPLVDPAVCHASPMASMRLAQPVKPFPIPAAPASTAVPALNRTVPATPVAGSDAAPHIAAPAAGPSVAAPAAPVPERFIAASGSAFFAAQEIFVSPAVTAAVRLGEPEAAPTPEPIRPAANPASDLPWWLSDAPHLATPVRPPVIWHPARTYTSRQADPVPESSAAAPIPGAERQTAPASPVQNWEHTSGPSSPIQGEAAAAQPQAILPEGTPASLASRLSGLRNLLYVLGVQNAQRSGEQQERQNGMGPAFDSRSERASFERNLSQDPLRAGAGSAQGPSPRLVTAQPEFLSPRPVVIEFEKLDDRTGVSSTRQDRRASADGVEILPSKRGQYKKV